MADGIKYPGGWRGPLPPDPDTRTRPPRGNETGPGDPGRPAGSGDQENPTTRRPMDPYERTPINVIAMKVGQVVMDHMQAVSDIEVDLTEEDPDPTREGYHTFPNVAILMNEAIREHAAASVEESMRAVLMYAQNEPRKRARGKIIDESLPDYEERPGISLDLQGRSSEDTTWMGPGVGGPGLRRRPIGYRPKWRHLERQVMAAVQGALDSGLLGYNATREAVLTLRGQGIDCGLNGKRGNADDPSSDVILFKNPTGIPTNNTADNFAVELYDVIMGDGGPNPQAGFIDITFEGPPTAWLEP